MAQQDRGASGSASIATHVRDGMKSLLRVGDLPGHADAGIRTRWFSVEVSLCAFRESLQPSVFADGKSMDLFIPLPGQRSLWVTLYSWWLSERLGKDPEWGSALAEVISDPPHECAADECEYETENYGVFLLHDQREHAVPLAGDHEASEEGR